MAINFQQKRRTAATWTSEDPILLAGQIGYESDTGLYKIGDGTTVWTSLAYVFPSFLRAASLGAAPSYVTLKVKSGPPDELYVSMQKTGGTWDWIPIAFAP